MNTKDIVIFITCHEHGIYDVLFSGEIEPSQFPKTVSPAKILDQNGIKGYETVHWEHHGGLETPTYIGHLDNDYKSIDDLVHPKTDSQIVIKISLKQY